jgi:MFS transporter, SP family, arabinose:H+ symporter
MALSAALAGIGLAYLSGTAKIVVVMVGLDVFIASFAMGVGGTGWLNFALIEVFPTWQSKIGLGWILVCFAALCLLITRLFEQPARTAIPVSHEDT